MLNCGDGTAVGVELEEGVGSGLGEGMDGEAEEGDIDGRAEDEKEGEIDTDGAGEGVWLVGLIVTDVVPPRVVPRSLELVVIACRGLCVAASIAVRPPNPNATAARPTPKPCMMYLFLLPMLLKWCLPLSRAA